MGRWSDKRSEVDEHHLVNYSQWWTDHPDNILNIDRKTHEALHTLFWNLWPIEMIKKLADMVWKCLSDGKAKDEFNNSMDYLTYKDTVLWDKRKKRK